MIEHIGYGALGAVRGCWIKWLCQGTGIIENIAKTTAPTFKAMVVLGAANGLSSKLREKIDGNDQVELALRIASRYVVAKVFHKVFGLQVENRFLCFLSVLDFTQTHTRWATWHFLMGKGIQFDEKYIYHFSHISTEEGALQFGALRSFISRCTSLTYRNVKKLTNLEDPRKQLLLHIALQAIFVIESLRYIPQKCNDYFQLNVKIAPSLFEKFMVCPTIYIRALAFHLWFDFIGANWGQVANSIATTHEQTCERINRFYHEENPLYRFEKLIDFICHLIYYYNGHNPLNSMFRKWKEGRPPEEILSDAIMTSVNNPAPLIPLNPTFPDLVTTQDSNADEEQIVQQGADFIVEILKESNDLFREKLQENPQEFKLFITYIAINAYIGGQNRDTLDEDLPAFFKGQSNKRIRFIRNLIRNGKADWEDYQNVQDRLLNKKRNFESLYLLKLAPYGLNGKQNAALDHLHITATSAQSSLFITHCFPVAIEKLR